MNAGIAGEWVGDHYYHLIKVTLWIGRQKDSGILMSLSPLRLRQIMIISFWFLSMDFSSFV